MSENLSSKLDLLKSLSSRAKPASEFFAEQPPNTPNRKNPISWETLIPHSEKLAFQNQRCIRITSRTLLSGQRNPQGYTCPADQYRLGAQASCLPNALAILTRDPRFLEVDPEKIAFIDTETTSLAGGTGTYTFLIGVGRFSGDSFVVNQYFMEDYTEEEALIEAVSDDLRAAEALASYNGKCFDVPLMEARWRVNRRPPRFPQLHLDLLHPSRRLWKLRCGSCRLGNMEREILNIMRVSDVNSALIPQIYFDFLRGVNRERMLPVLDHHAQDILSLGALVWALARALNAPADPRFDHESDHWGVSQILHSAGRHDEAITRLELAIQAARDEAFGFKLSMHLAKRLSRMGRLDESVEIWKARAAQARADRLEPLIQLAKHAEHRLKDFDQARHWTERAMSILQTDRELADWLGRQPSASAARQSELEVLEHRLLRVSKRKSPAASSFRTS